MPQFNQLNVAETAGRGRNEKQMEEFNALRMDASKQQMGQQKTAFDEETRMMNTKWLAGAAKYGMENPDSIPTLIKEGQRRGVLDPSLTAEGIGPEQLKSVYEGALAGLGGPEYTDETVNGRLMQRDQSGKLTAPGSAGGGPTSNMRDIAELQRLTDLYGPDDPLVKAMEAAIVTPKITTIGGERSRVGIGDPETLSTLAEEAAAANRLKMAEGEGGRGRSQQPTGEFTPVAGTEADIKEKEARRKRGAGAYMKSIQAQTVVEDTTRLRTQLQEGRVPFRREAALQEKLDPLLQSEDYRNAISLIESVKGNVGIDSLLRIKASGAGLGQVPQTQLDMLSRLLGELDLKQGEEQFTRTWDRMEQIYIEIMNTADEELAQLEMTRPDIFQIGDQEDTPVLRYNAQGKRIQ